MLKWNIFNPMPLNVAAAAAFFVIRKLFKE
jgi:hypothetical protein